VALTWLLTLSASTSGILGAIVIIGIYASPYIAILGVLFALAAACLTLGRTSYVIFAVTNLFVSGTYAGYMLWLLPRMSPV
jgi:hypothetical protein